MFFAPLAMLHNLQSGLELFLVFMGMIIYPLALGTFQRNEIIL